MRAAMIGLVAALSCGGAPALAEGPPKLRFPVDCVLGRSCFLQQFVDHDPGPGARDFACGQATYDGHRGTDLRISRRDMERGVAVLAARGGRVRALRDGMADGGLEEGQAVAGRDCGNGVILDHAEGWSTQYCHLKQGSLRVAVGDWVAPGAVLGEIGLSGATEFAHLHLTLRRGERIVDPFAPGGGAGPGPGALPERPAECQGPGGAHLWDDDRVAAAAAQPTRLIELGRAAEAPEMDAALAGAYDDLPVDAQAPIVIWAVAINGRPGDRIEIALNGPDGPLVRPRGQALSASRAQVFRFSGRRPPEGGWPAGRYLWRVRVLREGRVLDSRAGQIDMP